METVPNTTKKKQIKRPETDRFGFSPELMRRAGSSSPTFLRLVDAVESVLCVSVGALIDGHINPVARVIVARLSQEQETEE